MRTIAVLLLAASVAAADEVTLKSGKTFSGIAREEGETVVLEMGIGTVTIPKDQVSRVTFGSTMLHEFYDRLKACAKVDDLLALARGANIPRLANVALRRVLELDPENAEARRRLGHVKIDGRWTTREEQEDRERSAEAAAGARSIEERLEEKRREREDIARIEEDYRRQIAEIRRDAGLEPPPPRIRVYPWDYSFLHPRVAPGAVAGVPLWRWTVVPRVRCVRGAR